MGPSDARRIGDVTDGPAAAGCAPNPAPDVVRDRGVLAPLPESWSLKGAGAAAGGAMVALCGSGWCIGGDCM